ncbi:30S ribosomal protein S4 [Candidatus Gottesmanbacteria bacterium]|nr:30S ribosomal protein S4 [Candidatus Gottesmanbacteria bacterium]
MARYTGPKNKIARREGVNLGLKTLPPKVEKRLGVLPGQHGKKGRRKVSEFGLQLREKQKVKSIYGVLEKQFRKYFVIAAKSKSATGETLLTILERRLDNVVYRLGMAPTRAAARQIVAHRHVLVNNKKVNIPAYLVKADDVIVLDNKASSIPEVKKLLAEQNMTIPSWLIKKGGAGKVVKIPTRADIDATVTEQLIVEFYSR